MDVFFISLTLEMELASLRDTCKPCGITSLDGVSDVVVRGGLDPRNLD